MPKTKPEKQRPTVAKVLPYILIVAGVIGMICAFVLTFDELRIAHNPNYIPSCNLNPVIACGSVMKSNQAHLFGFPNPWIGLMAFPVLVTTGVALLAGATLKKWYWRGLELGTFLGLVFIHWLFFETVYRIHALCPYCMVVWVVTITSFWYVTLYNFDHGNFTLPAGNAQKAYAWVRRHHLDILLLWFLIIAALILKHFWYYYGKYF